MRLLFRSAGGPPSVACLSVFGLCLVLMLPWGLVSAPRVAGPEGGAIDLELVQRHLQMLQAGADRAYPPFEFQGVRGAEGFNVDLLREVARVMGVGVQIGTGPWSEVRHQLETGHLDVLCGMFRSDERDDLVDFSAPHIWVSHALLVPRLSPVRSLDDLNQRVVAVENGDIMHDYAQKSLVPNGATLLVCATPLAALQALKEGQCQAALLGTLQAAHLCRKHPELSGILAVQGDLLPQAYCFAVPEGRQEVLTLLNEGLARVKASGAYDAIHQKWFGRMPRANWFWRNRFWVMAVLGGILLILFLAGFWVVMLRRMVASSTRAFREELAERARAQEALTESEERYRGLFQENPLALMLLDPRTGRVVEGNPAACRYYGYAPQVLAGLAWERIQVGFQGGVPDGSGDSRRERQQHLLATGESRMVDVTMGPMLWHGQRLICMHCHDVTSRIEAEKALLESEQRFVQVLEHLPLALMVVQNDTLIYLNPEARRLMGLGGADVAAPHHLDAVFGTEFRKTILKGGGKTMGSLPRLPCRFPGDREGWMECSSSTIQFSQKPAVMLTLRDVTGQVREEETLRQSQRRGVEATSLLDLLMDHLPDPVVVRDRQLRVVRASQIYLQGMQQKGEDGGGTVEEEQGLDPDTQAACQRALTGVGARSSMVLRSGREERFLDLQWYPVKDETGTIWGVCGLGRDRTWEVHLEGRVALLEDEIRSVARVAVLGTRILDWRQQLEGLFARVRGMGGLRAEEEGGEMQTLNRLQGMLALIADGCGERSMRLEEALAEWCGMEGSGPGVKNPHILLAQAGDGEVRGCRAFLAPMLDALERLLRQGESGGNASMVLRTTLWQGEEDERPSGICLEIRLERPESFALPDVPCDRPFPVTPYLSALAELAGAIILPDREPGVRLCWPLWRDEEPLALRSGSGEG